MSILRFYGNKRENDVSVDYIRCEHDGCGGEAPPSERGEDGMKKYEEFKPKWEYLGSKLLGYCLLFSMA